MIKKQPQAAGDFDAEVDSARKRLEASMNEDTGFDDLAALQALAPILADKIRSRRLAFTLGDDEDDETQIAVIHVQTDEELGFIFAEDGEYVFESNLEAYFDDFVDDDPARFVERLYETLRADLPKYEVENKS
jgi:trehalose-6-phosphatase